MKPEFETHVNKAMRDSMREFLRDFDSYGYKKILCEEYFAGYAAQHPGQISFIALRLADVIGPYDESWRFWKYCTWIKAHLGLPTRLDSELTACLKSTKIWYEVPKDTDRKLSITFSVDVVKFILASLETTRELEPFFAVNLACEEQVTLLELIKLIQSEI